MRIKWCGTASLLIEGGDTRILVDPYLRSFGRRLTDDAVAEMAQADAAFITHPHIDHFGDIGEFFAAGLGRAYVAEKGIRHAAEWGVDTSRMSPLAAYSSTAVGDMTVRAYPSQHCKFDAATVLKVWTSPRSWRHFATAMRLLRGTLHYSIDSGDIFALRFEQGGRSIMVLGSAGAAPDVDYPTGDDLLAIAYQGHSHIDEYVRPIVERFAPKAAMPTHFDDAFPPVSSEVSTDGFADAVHAVLPDARAFVPQEGQWYEV